MSDSELATMKTYVRDYLANGFIRHSKSAAAAPVMFVMRPDGKLRFVVDYRSLNRVTIKNRYPLPLIPEMLDRLHRAKIFTKISAMPIIRLGLRKEMSGRRHLDAGRGILNTGGVRKGLLTPLQCFSIL